MSDSTGRHAADVPRPVEDVPDGDRAMLELEAEILQLREDVAHTIDQLAERLDVKARVRRGAVAAKDQGARRVRALRAQVTEEAGGRQTLALAVAGTTAVLTVVAVVAAVRRRR